MGFIKKIRIVAITFVVTAFSAYVGMYLGSLIAMLFTGTLAPTVFGLNEMAITGLLSSLFCLERGENKQEDE